MTNQSVSQDSSIVMQGSWLEFPSNHAHRASIYDILSITFRLTKINVLLSK